MKSSVVKHSIVIAGRRTSVSLENEFWKGLREIARHRKMSVSALVTKIKADRQHANLCSAIRLFVLGVYCARIEDISHAEAEREQLSAVANELGLGTGGHP
jgi:predicted DNA-binding ribbon-helix-helix protein